MAAHVPPSLGGEGRGEGGRFGSLQFYERLRPRRVVRSPENPTIYIHRSLRVHVASSQSYRDGNFRAYTPKGLRCIPTGSPECLPTGNAISITVILTARG